jgi:hypothetical protein
MELTEAALWVVLIGGSFSRVLFALGASELRPDTLICDGHLVLSRLQRRSRAPGPSKTLCLGPTGLLPDRDGLWLLPL